MEDFKHVLCSVVSGVFSLLFPIKDFMTAVMNITELSTLRGIKYIRGHYAKQLANLIKNNYYTLQV